MTHTILVWLKGTELSQLMTSSRWLWPVCETLHFIGLSLLIGAAGLFDLRLMGWLKAVPVAAAMRMRGWAAAGIAINLVTGAMFFVGAPDQYISNPAWWWKVAFLAVAIANVAVFETIQGAKVLAMTGNEETPRRFKIAGAISMAAWLGVLYFGRMLPFIGQAF